MRRQFREDENELPYLVSSRRDDDTRSSAAGHQRVINVENRPAIQFESTVRNLPLHPDDEKIIIESITIEVKNCNFSIKRVDEGLMFKFDVANKYVSTHIYFTYGYHGFMYVDYYDSYGGLESMDWFKREVSRICAEEGVEYYSMGGGFRCDFSADKVVIRDYWPLIVYFNYKDDRDEYPGYKIDFDNGKLVEYHIYDGFEFSDYVV